MSNQIRNKDAGMPGNGGQFAAESPRTEPTNVVLGNGTVDWVAIGRCVKEANRVGQPVLVPASAIPGNDGVQVDKGGSTGGDVSLGKEFSRRFTWATGEPARPFVSATATYWITARRDSDNYDLDYSTWEEVRDEYDDWLEADAYDQIRRFDGIQPEPVSYAYDERVEFLWHTDPSDPGNSEVDSQDSVNDGSGLTFYSLEDAERAASAACHREDPAHYDMTKDPS
jgi:hypothetical protein